MNRILTPRTVVHLLLFLATAAVVALLTTCSRPQAGQASPKAPEPAAESAGAAVYTIRGEVRELPDPNDPLSGFYVRHEAVSGFRNIDGQVVGMDAMTMAFPVADDLSFEGISVGDPVQFTLKVDWNGDPLMLVTSIEKLPPGTRLDLPGAKPDQPSS